MAGALGKIGPSAKPAVPLLRRAAKEYDDDPIAHGALALIEGKFEEHLPPMVAATKHEQRLVRQLAAYALGELGLRARPALPALTRLSDDPSPDVRRAATETATASTWTSPSRSTTSPSRRWRRAWARAGSARSSSVKSKN